MRLALAAAATTLLLLPGCLGAQPAPPAPAEGSSVAYACAGGATLQVAYINAAGGASYAVVSHGGRLAAMQAGPTGSGVRYVSIDGSGLVWHTKGDAGLLARDTDTEPTIASDCRAES